MLASKDNFQVLGSRGLRSAQLYGMGYTPISCVLVLACPLRQYREAKAGVHLEYDLG